MSESWNRREFIKRAAAGTAILGTTAGISIAASDSGRKESDKKAIINQVRDFTAVKTDKRPLLIVSNGSPEKALKAAITKLGGIEKFISKGDTVVLKPNIGWDRTPVQAANTNPIVVKTMVELCFKAGAKEVIVTDNSCNDPARCFTRSGIWKLAEQAGAEIILPAEHRFSDFNLGGVILGTMPVLTPAVHCDKFINMPIAKHHGLSKFTGAMKNLYGVLGGRRNRLHQSVDDSIADLADFIRPTLTVMDATRVLMQNGPQGGNISDTKQLNKIIVSTDQVAVDAVSCQLIGLTPGQLPYLKKAQDRNLGISDISKIEVVEIFDEQG
ncbi:MAG: DUF362 domain-containing protein [Deltaproteobacteria bacterium]|nr:DUF362 domain-containing protein [Deltaproteobacteria bacterium]